MSTYSLYHYSREDGEDIYYINNNLLSTLSFPVNNTYGILLKLDVSKDVVDSTINQSGLSKINISFHLVEAENDKGYYALLQCFIHENRHLNY